MDISDATPGTAYAVSWKDCCTAGGFVAVLDSVADDEAVFSNGVTISGLAVELAELEIQPEVTKLRHVCQEQARTALACSCCILVLEGKSDEGSDPLGDAGRGRG
jgi:hypothetical protein